MSQLNRWFGKGLFLAGALATSAVMHAAGPLDSVPANGVAQANSSLLVPGAFAVAAVTDDLRYRTEGVSTSNDAVDAEVASLSASPADTLGSSGQYGSGRRRTYGRSRYQDRLHNADGSTKIAFMGGAGLNLPVGNTGKYYTPSYDVEVGAGLNFSRRFGVLGEFHYNHAGLTGNAINYEYANALPIVISEGGSSADLAGFDGNSHVYSITVDPVVTFTSKESPFGAYVTGGVGFYHKTTNFTVPSTGTGYNGYYYYQYTANVNIDSYGAGGLGANGGFGLTYRLSEFSSERLFLEARYEWMKLSTNNQEFFPFNKRNSEYVPIAFGIRF